MSGFMTASRNLGHSDGRPVASSSTASADPHAARGGRRRALLGLAAVASVLTAGCTPLVTAGGGGHSTGVKKPAASGHLTFGPSADAFVYADAPTRNMGADPRLVASTIPDQGKASLPEVLRQRHPRRSLRHRRTCSCTAPDHHAAVDASRRRRPPRAGRRWPSTARNAPAVGTTVATRPPGVRGDVR